MGVTSEDLARQTAAFQAAGGQVEQVPMGASGLTKDALPQSGTRRFVIPPRETLKREGRDLSRTTYHRKWRDDGA